MEDFLEHPTTTEKEGGLQLGQSTVVLEFLHFQELKKNPVESYQNNNIMSN